MESLNIAIDLFERIKPKFDDFIKNVGDIKDKFIKVGVPPILD